VADRRVGIFGGTFDPIHVGHLIAAEEARVRLALERVILVPARVSPHKLDEDAPAPCEQRYRMVCDAVADNPWFSVSSFEVERDRPSYTVDTLRHFRAEYGPDVALYLIMGMDALQGFSRWRDPSGILALARLVVISRPGYPLSLAEHERSVPGLTARTTVLDTVDIGISSTDLRARVRAGLPIRYRVPAVVEQTIAAYGLYQVDRTPTRSCCGI